MLTTPHPCLPDTTTSSSIDKRPGNRTARTMSVFYPAWLKISPGVLDETTLIRGKSQSPLGGPKPLDNTDQRQHSGQNKDKSE